MSSSRCKAKLNQLLKGACALTLACGLSPFAPMSALADEGQTSEAEAEYQKLIDQMSLDVELGNTCDFTSGDASSTNSLSANTLPSAFSLQHVGGDTSYNTETKSTDFTGGTNYVTSVKNQSPFANCWAFAAIAASETSILYELGHSADEDSLNLSERHLAWFARTHLPAESTSSQAGEGTWMFDESAGAERMEWAMIYYATGAFASGAGPVPESTATDANYAPYQGNNGIVTAYIEQDGKRTVKDFASFEDAVAEGYTPTSYSADDDWSLSEDKRFVHLYTLQESSILPDMKNANAEGIAAAKSELLNGRAVSIAFCADVSTPSQSEEETESIYINSNWAHYTWRSATMNHAVTIVGWDDDYAAENFTQIRRDVNNNKVYHFTDAFKEAHPEIAKVYSGDLANDDDGNPYYQVDGKVTYPDSSEIELSHEVPAGNGAWIVKNSWGASSQSFPNNKEWGVNGEGYFYLSYYDKSISNPESFDFATSVEEQASVSYDTTYQYDFMPSNSVFAYSPANATTVKMANVFTASENTLVANVSCLTPEPNATVTYEMYLLNDGYTNPADGKLVATTTATYTYGGYHRTDLTTPVMVPKGQSFSIVVKEETPSAEGTKSVVSITACPSKSYAEQLKTQFYTKSVVNKGESYILVEAEDGSSSWNDWSQGRVAVGGTMLEIDNLGIKAYANTVSTALGDANNNGSINVVDAQVVYDMAIGQYGDDWSAVRDCYPATTTKAVVNWVADANGDGTVYAEDARAIQNYALTGAWK